jgi:hypothetical protein
MGKKFWKGGGNVTESWRSSLEKIADWVPVDFLLGWIDVESNGIPTIIELGADPRGERGLFQVHPDEREYLGLTQEQFEALTKDIGLALRTGVKHAKMFAYQAKRALNNVGQEWHGRDFWKLVKLYHGAFGMPNTAVNAFKRSKGRGPDTWDELMAFALDEAKNGRALDPANPQLSTTLRNLTKSTFENAQDTGERSELPIIARSTVSSVAPVLRQGGLLL